MGDLLKVGERVGTVEDVGLRSTRLRTFDRTVFTVPNGQIPNVGLENFSLRDSYWFHHIVSPRYETTASQMRSVPQGIVSLLEKYPLANHFPMPVRFLRLGAYSLDVEIFAHLAARLAIPAQTAQLAASSGSDLSLESLLDTPGQRGSKKNRDAA